MCVCECQLVLASSINIVCVRLYVLWHATTKCSSIIIKIFSLNEELSLKHKLPAYGCACMFMCACVWSEVHLHLNEKHTQLMLYRIAQVWILNRK